MGNNDYRRDMVKEIIVRQEGDTLHILGAEYFPSKMDYSDEERIKILATKAVHTANGLADLVNNNCDIQNPDSSPEVHLEMYLSLAALTCEIYMKSIIYNENLHNGEQVWGHYLDELFEKLPDAVKDELIQKYPTIQTTLHEIRDVFERLRYDFEQFHIQGDYLLVFQLMEELKNISNRYPKKESGLISFANGVMHIR